MNPSVVIWKLPARNPGSLNGMWNAMRSVPGVFVVASAASGIVTSPSGPGRSPTRCAPAKSTTADVELTVMVAACVAAVSRAICTAQQTAIHGTIAMCIRLDVEGWGTRAGITRADDRSWFMVSSDQRGAEARGGLKLRRSPRRKHGPEGYRARATPPERQVV